MHAILLEAPLVVLAAVAIALSPFGRETLTSVRHSGLTLHHARHLLHVMTAVAVLVATVAFFNLH